MADIIDSTAEDLFFKLRNRFPNVQMGDSLGKVTSDPFSARFFNFVFETNDEKFGSVTVSIIDNQSLKIYFSQDLIETMEFGVQDSWFSFLKELRRFAKGHMLMFDVRDITKKSLDANDIKFISQYNAKKNNTVTESRVEWHRKGMYSNGQLGEVKINVVHSEKMHENPYNRLLKVKKIYLINPNGEKFLLPFNSVLGAKAMAHHVARGGTPYDTDGQTICKAVGEMRNLQRFHRVTKNKTFEDDSTNKIIAATALVKEDIRKHLVRLANGRYFEETLDELTNLTKLDDPRVSEEIKNMFIQKHFDERLNDWIQSAALAYKKVEEKTMSSIDEAKGSVIQKIMDPNFKLILKKDSAIDLMIASSKYSNQNGMIARVLSDIAERLITPDADDVANYAAKMADIISSEGAAFGQRMTDDYKKEKALAVRLVAKYVGDMNKMKQDAEYAQQVRKDPKDTMGAKKDLYGKPKTEAEEFESYIKGLGEEDEEEMLDQIAADEEGFGQVTEEPSELEEAANKFSPKDVEIAAKFDSKDPVMGMGKIWEITPSGKLRFYLSNGHRMALNKLMSKSIGSAEDWAMLKKQVKLHLASTNVTEEPNEGNEFSGALAKAKAAGQDEFEVGGKRYKVKEGAKPDHLDLDNDGNEREPMKLAAKQARKANENTSTTSSTSSDEDDDIARINAVTKDLKDMSKPKGPLKLPNVNAPGVPDMFKTENQDKSNETLKSIKQLAGLKTTESEQVNEQEVIFYGYTSGRYPLEQAVADKAYRKGKLVKLTMDYNGRPMAIIDDPRSMGEYQAYWNDKIGAWTIDFD